MALSIANAGGRAEVLCRDVGQVRCPYMRAANKNEIRAVLHHADQEVSSSRRLNQNAILPPGGLRLKILLNFQNQNPA